jgi:hypothetical protein
MAARLWFTPKSIRRITLRSYAVLVGKAPTKQKRIKMLCTMPLTGQKLTGFPDWLADARDFVMKNGEVIHATQTINYVNVTMSDELLFGPTPIEAPKCKLSHMAIENMGGDEDPVTALKFQIMAPFSTDLNRWCGQMAGEEFSSTYQVTETPDEEEDEEEGELVLTGGEEEEDESDEEGGEDDALADSEDEDDELQAQERRRNAKIVAAPKPKPPAKKPLTESQQIAKAKEAIQLM